MYSALKTYGDGPVKCVMFAIYKVYNKNNILPFCSHTLVGTVLHIIFNCVLLSPKGKVRTKPGPRTMCPSPKWKIGECRFMNPKMREASKH